MGADGREGTAREKGRGMQAGKEGPERSRVPASVILNILLSCGIICISGFRCRASVTNWHLLQLAPVSPRRHLYCHQNDGRSNDALCVKDLRLLPLYDQTQKVIVRERLVSQVTDVLLTAVY